MRVEKLFYHFQPDELDLPHSEQHSSKNLPSFLQIRDVGGGDRLAFHILFDH